MSGYKKMARERKVIVTGASQGIGFAIAKNLLQNGFSVHIIARRKKRLEKAAAKLGSYGKVTYSTVNLTDRKEVYSFSKKWTGVIYGLVNNAGCWAEEKLSDPDSDIWDPIMELNLEGLYFLTKGMQKHIVTGGRIVNISSQLGTSGRSGMGAYAASKHAVIGLTRCWALELSDRRITVNVVCPGWVNTASNRKEIKGWTKGKKASLKEKMQEIAAPTTLRRFIEPEEVANLVGFLAGSTGSGITGQIYEIK